MFRKLIGKIAKAGHNAVPSQIAERPAPPKAIDKVHLEAALQRAAHKAVHGTREERSGRFYEGAPTMPQHTKDKLADALRMAGLHDMADKAATGYYHDFLSDLDLPCLQLDIDLAAAATPAAQALRERHANGEFDASLEESEAWADSDDGQETMGRLIGTNAKIRGH